METSKVETKLEKTKSEKIENSSKIVDSIE